MEDKLNILKATIDIDVSKINQAKKIQEEIEKKYEEMDSILNPICMNIANTGNSKDVDALIQLLPQGFHRSEMRVLYSKKMEQEHNDQKGENDKL